MNDNQAEPAADPVAAQPGDTGLGLPVAQSADPIDQVVRLAPKWTLSMLVACALMIAAALVWAFAGEITQTVSRPGVLRDSGYQTVKFTSDGTVETIRVKPGDRITNGTPILDFEDKSQLLSAVDGHVSSVYQSHGARVKAGDTAISITDYTKPDRVFVLLPASMVGTVKVGLPVEVEFSNAPAARYGYAKGWIETLSTDSVTTEDLAQRLGIAEKVVAAALGGEPGLATMIGLEADLKNPSTLAWTVGKGPDFVPAHGTPVTVSVILSAQRPINVLFPTHAAATTHRAAP
jgi:hypothetical protein